ncbi:hypothetical protein [Nostoc sp.]
MSIQFMSLVYLTLNPSPYTEPLLISCVLWEHEGHHLPQLDALVGVIFLW